MTLGKTSGNPSPEKGGRRLTRRAALAVAAAGLAALTACGSGGSGKTLSGIGENGLYGSIPAATSGTQHTGTIKIAQISGMSPWILPIITAADNSIYTVNFFDDLMWRPLYWFPKGTSQVEDKQLSLASDPTWSNGDKTVTFKLKSNYKWSDGQPVTSKDVLFWFDVTKAGLKESPANWAGYTPGLGIPDEVSSVTTPDASTVTFNLKKAVNPTWFFESQLGGAGGIQPMPSHAWAKASANGPALDYTNPANAKKIYDFLASASKSVATYASNPLWQIVDGPYKLTSFNTTSDDWSMTPNPSYGGPHVKTPSPVQMNFYATSAAEFNAVKAGDATVGYVPIDNVPEAGSLKSAYNLFGYPGLGFHAVFYNFKDTTGDFDKIIGQLYFRQALAHLDDQQGIIKALYHGAGAPQYGVVGKYPPLPATPPNSLTDPYPYSPTTAVNILKSHGWNVVPGGTSTCAKPGTGANECGAGIPAGTKLAWNLLYASESAVSGQISTTFSSALKAIGASVTLKSDSFNDIIENYNDVSAPKNDSKWAMSMFGGENFLSPYVTTFGLFNSTGSGNIGGYADPQADKRITASVAGTDPNALTAELAYITQSQPAWFVPAEDYASAGGIMAISKQVSGDPDSFSTYTQSYLLPEFWYFKK